MDTGNSEPPVSNNGGAKGPVRVARPSTVVASSRPVTRRSRSAFGDTRSDRLVSEAVMAGLDSVSAEHARVAVGARVGSGGGGGGLPDAPNDRTETGRTETPGLPAEPDLDTERRIDVPEPGTDNADLDAAIAKKEPSAHPLVAFGATMNRFIGEAGEMTALGGQMLKSGIVRPKGYWGDVKDQIYDG